MFLNLKTLKLAMETQNQLVNESRDLQVPEFGVRTFQTNLASARIESRDKQVFEYLSEFFAVANPEATVGREIRCVRSASEFPCNKGGENRFGVSYAVLDGNLHLASSDPINLGISARKALREIHLHECEKRAFTVLHGSAMYNDDHVVLFIGTNGAGKTTLALDGWLNHGYRLLANDHIVMLRDEVGIAVTGLTTFFTLKFAHVEHVFPALSKVVAPHFPNIDGYRTEAQGNPRHPFYFGPQQFGVGDIPILSLGEAHRALRVVLPTMDLSRSNVIHQTSQEVFLDEITQQIRTEWVYNSDSNPQFFSFPRRTESVFHAESQALCKVIADTGMAFQFRHSCSIDPLLSLL